MRVALVTEPGIVEVREAPAPRPGPYEALVRIAACSLCNSTDVKLVDRYFMTTIPLPFILGHESVGTIIEVGAKVRHLAPGQQVLRPGAAYDTSVTPIYSAWGGLAEYGLVADVAAWRADHPDEPLPNGMWPKQQIVPPEIPPAEATVLITLKEALFSARAAGIGPETWTAIVGTGPVARAFTFWARYLAAPFVVVFGRSERWCHDFLDLGANNYIAGELPCRMDEAKVAGLRAFDRVIEAVGSSAAVEDALALVRPDGLVGVYGVAAEGDRAESTAAQAARAAGRLITLPVREEEAHAEVLSLVAQGRVRLSDWISHRLPLSEVAHGLDLVRTKQATKVVIEL
jgi:threonine dehydrogenase-like Zn-dependent dehydrogenase